MKINLLILLLLQLVYGRTDTTFAKLTIASEIIQMRGESNTIKNYCTSIILQSTEQYILQNQNRLTGKDIETIQKINNGFLRELSENNQEIVDSMASVYISYYTLNDLKKLRNFFKSNVGGKLLQFDNEIRQSYLTKSGAVVRNMINRYILRLEPFLRERGLEKFYTIEGI